jgi:hypothetical protein
MQPRGLIDPIVISMIAAQLYPAIESWGEHDQAESAVDAATRIVLAAQKKVAEINNGLTPPPQEGPSGMWGSGPVIAFETPR